MSSITHHLSAVAAAGPTTTPPVLTEGPLPLFAPSKETVGIVEKDDAEAHFGRYKEKVDDFIARNLCTDGAKSRSKIILPEQIHTIRKYAAMTEEDVGRLYKSDPKTYQHAKNIRRVYFTMEVNGEVILYKDDRGYKKKTSPDEFSSLKAEKEEKNASAENTSATHTEEENNSDKTATTEDKPQDVAVSAKKNTEAAEKTPNTRSSTDAVTMRHGKRAYDVYDAFEVIKVAHDEVAHKIGATTAKVNEVAAGIPAWVISNFIITCSACSRKQPTPKPPKAPTQPKIPPTQRDQTEDATILERLRSLEERVAELEDDRAITAANDALELDSSNPNKRPRIDQTQAVL